MLYYAADLPDILIDFTKYRDTEYDIPTLKDLIKEEILQGSIIIRKYHFKISKIARSKQIRYPTRPKALSQYLRTGTGILASMISRLLRNTIFHLMDVTLKGDQIPFIKLNLTYENGLILNPSAETTSQLYADIAKGISGAANELLNLECIVDEDLEEQYIPIYIQNDFLEECAKKMSENIEVMYEPVHAYVNRLQSSFAALYPDTDGERPQEANEISFEDGYKHLKQN